MSFLGADVFLCTNKTYPSIATFFMMVSLPDEAAVATCCSMLLLIFALNC